MIGVGLIGLGLLGSALSERLISAGYQIQGFDVNEDRRATLHSIGGSPLDSAVAVIQSCQTILLSLPDSKSVSDVMESVHSSLDRHLIIDTTTGAPDDSARLGEFLSRSHVEYLDATVVGSSEQARRCETMVLSGGTLAGFEAALPVLRCFSSQQFHTGSWGTGATAKLIVNLVLGLNRAVLAEALNLARRTGMDQRSMLEILRSGAAYSRVMDLKGEKMLSGDFAPQARLDQHAKDVRLILDVGKSSGSQLPLSELHSVLLERASMLGFGQQDNSAIIKAFES